MGRLKSSFEMIYVLFFLILLLSSADIQPFARSTHRGQSEFEMFDTLVVFLKDVLKMLVQTTITYVKLTQHANIFHMIGLAFIHQSILINNKFALFISSRC